MRASGVLVVIALALTACSADGEAGSTPSAPPSSAADAGTASSVAEVETDPTGLRAAGDEAGVRVGVALSSVRLDDPAVEDLVAAEFSSLTPENEMKWSVVEPERDTFDFAGADRLVAYAEDHDMEVRGHTLVWGQAVGNGLPDWLAGLSPDEVAAEVGVFIDTSVERYAGRVDRWDVVNEPLAITGDGIDDNPLTRALGPDWVAWSLERAALADPDAELWINENNVELQPEKADLLVDLVEDLLAAGAPLDGVGLQTHLFTGVPPAAGVVGGIVERLRGLGLDVAITELDVPLVPSSSPATQAAAYAQIVGECIDAGCEEVTVWGLDDGHTWLDTFLGRERTDPLLFDRDLQPKPAHAAVVEVLGGR